MHRTLASLVLAAMLTGCPSSAEGPVAPTVDSLKLSVNEPAPPKVGERRGFTVSYGPTGEQQLMSALIANENPCLTRWHADPADAVTFEENGAAATFKRSGNVKIWATVTSPDGKEVVSNALEVAVAQ